jgi:hypothetical protein
MVMGCSLEPIALSAEEAVLVKNEARCCLAQMPSELLHTAVCKFAAADEITPGQLIRAIEMITDQTQQRREMNELLSDVPRGALLAFLILIGKGKPRDKAEMFFELGTDAMSTDELGQGQAEALADDLISAATEVGLKLGSGEEVARYGRQMARLKAVTVERLAAKMLGGRDAMELEQFIRSFGRQKELLTLSGLRLFVLSCGEKTK